jgi:branched-chain amino acid aminotransferase
MQKIPPLDRLIWVNGEWVPWEQVTVHVLSHCAQRGSLVFDYMSIHETPRGAAVFRMDLHIRRMLHSCELMGLPIAMDEEALAAAIVAAARVNPGAKAVKASAYFASVEVDVVPANQRVSVAIAAYDPQTDILDQNPLRPAKREGPTRLWLEKEAHQRREDIVSPQAKVSANYASSMTAKARAQRMGFDEILLLDQDGLIAEGPTSNVFVVDDEGRVLTPPEVRVLRGVTRQSIMEIAQHRGIEVREQKISPEQLFEASEIFLTGTTAGVLPVESVDGRPVGDACPGSISLQLKDCLARVERGEDPDFSHWLTYLEEGSD